MAKKNKKFWFSFFHDFFDMFCCDFSLKKFENHQFSLIFIDFREFSVKNHNKTCEKSHEKMKTENFYIFFCHWNLHKDALYENLGATESGKYSKPRDFFFISLFKNWASPKLMAGLAGLAGSLMDMQRTKYKGNSNEISENCDFLRNFSTFVVYTVNLC